MKKTIVDETAGAQTLRRGLGILKLLARYQPTGLRISDIGRKTGLNKATAVRLTRALTEEMFVAQDAATHQYKLGPESFAVGLAAEPDYVLQRRAAPVLRSLALETGDWVFFSVRQGYEAVCLSRESGDTPYPAAALKIGLHHPLSVGTGGIAMLAAMSDEEIELVLEQTSERIARDYPMLTLPIIRDLVKDTQSKGYCVLPGLIVPGYWGLGVALLQKNGQPVAAITLVTTQARLNNIRQVVLGERIRRLAFDLMAQELA